MPQHVVCGRAEADALVAVPHFRAVGSTLTLGAVVMAGHPLLSQVRTKIEPMIVDGKTYQIILSYNQVIGIDGYVVGLKFTDEVGSMDSAKAGNAHGIRLANAVAYRAIQMIRPDLAAISILGFYLLTEDLEQRSTKGALRKTQLYSAKAGQLQREFIARFQHLTEFEVDGGAAWLLSEKPYHAYSQYPLLEKELAKQLRVNIC